MSFSFRRFRAFLAKVYSLVRPYGRRRLGVVFLFMLAQGAFQVVGVTSIFPFLALAAEPENFRQSGIGSRLLEFLPGMSNSQLLLLAGTFALLMLLLSNALMLSGEVVRVRYSQGLGHWLRMHLLRRIVGNPYSYFLQRNTGELMKKASGDVGAFVNGVLRPLLEATARLVTVTFLLLTLVAINPLLALSVAAGFGIFYTIVFAILKNRRQRTSARMKLANRGAFREIQQLLGGIKPVKVHGVEEAFLNRYSHHSFTQAVLQKWIPIYNNAPRYLVEPLAFGGIVVFVMLLAAKGENFTSQIPMLGVMALAGYRLIPNFQLLYGSASGMSFMMHSLEEVYEEFHIEEGTDGQQRSDVLQRPREGLQWRNQIALDGITFTYSGAPEPAIRDLCLTVPRNSFVALIGETGSGKSTLVDIILGLHWPQGGRILLDERPLRFEELRKWRAGIGYVPQEIFLLDDTVAANIAFGEDPRSIDMEQVRLVAEVAQIRSFVETELTEGFQTPVGERGVRLSGGQRQRIGLARALYHKPSLLVLDEATSALDNTTEAALMEAMESLYGQMTLVVIAHRLSTVRKADCIYRLEKGRLAQAGTFEELQLQA